MINYKEMKKITFTLLILFLFAVEMMAQTAANKKNTNGKKQGFWEENSPVGITKGTYVDDQKEGCWSTYAPDGKLIRVEGFRNGLRDGITIDIDQRGYLVSETFYVNNLIEGTAKKYFYGTNLASSIDYLHGLINGKKKIYYENTLGKLMEESDYKDDLKNGSSKFFSSAGDLIAEYQYANNMLQGIQKTYNLGKKIMSEQVFVDNIENGYFKEYFENGNLKSWGNYEKGILNGNWKEYDEKGVLKSQGNYSNGAKEGVWQEYDATGKISKKKTFVKGVAK